MPTLFPTDKSSFPIFNRFSWPTLILVVVVHAVLFIFILTGTSSFSPTITPPIVGVLISAPSIAGGNAQSKSNHNQQKVTRTGQNINKKTNNPVRPIKESHESSFNKSISNTDNRDKTAPNPNDISSSSDALGSGNEQMSGQGSIFSPRVDANHANNPKPPYPLTSRRMGEEGTVILAVHVLASGKVDKILLKKSSGYPRLDKAAMTGVQKWRYIPAKKGNTPIDYWHTQAIRFSLND